MKMTTGTGIWMTFVHNIGSISTTGSVGRAGNSWNLCKVGLEYADPAPARLHPAAGPSRSRSRKKAQGLWNVVSSGHLIYRLLIQEVEENLTASSIWSIYDNCMWQKTRPFSRQFPSVQRPAEKHTAPWVTCSAPPGAATEPPGLPSSWDQWLEGPAGPGLGLPAELPWLCFPWEPDSWGPAWFISSI